MVSRKPFPLRLSPEILEAVQRWADDELRSVNAQMEWALRDALRRAGRLKRTAPARPANPDQEREP
jgi:hypothetical protein